MRKILPIILWVISLSAQVAFSQTITGAITGTVTDPSGAVVPNVKVTATNTATNVTFTAQTNESGIYNLLFLPAGEYRLTTETQGFKASQLGPFRLEVNQTARVDIALQVGATTETVEVTAVAPVLQTESSTTGDTITATQTVALPLRGRNFMSLTLLVPGSITPNPNSFDGPSRSFGGGRPYVNGNREQTNNFLLDGADINESIDNLVSYNPNIDALQEVKVMTGNAGAEFGNANGAIVNMTLKGGTNEFHGNVFEFLRNDNLDANGFFANRNRVNRREFKRNIFGGTLGGPIARNKMFFFLDYQGTRQRSSGPASASVAPPDFRQGDLSRIPRQIIDPTTGQQFPGNRIPASRIVNPVARALFADPSLYPLPNNVGTGPLLVTSNFLGTSSSFNSNDQADAKLDWRFSDNDNLSGRFTIARYREAPNTVVLPTFIGNNKDAPTTGGVITWIRSFSPTVVNEARLNFNRVRILDTPTDPTGLLGMTGNQKLGIAGGQPVAGASRVEVGEGINDIGGAGGGSDNITNTFQYGDNLTWQKGRHLVKMGGQAIRYQQNRFYAGNNGLLGFFRYDGRFTGSAFADFLLDVLSAKGRGSFTGMWGHRQWRDALFLQDDIKVSPNMTVNLGLRWEYTQPVYEVANRQLNIDIYTGQIRRAGQDGNSRALYEPYWKQFMPRLGFAWSPEALERRFVVRLGYGITSYMEGTGANLRLPLNPPFFFESQVEYATGTPGSIRPGFTDVLGAPPGQIAGQPRAWNPNLRPAFIQQYNFSLEYMVSPSLSATAAYVGQKGTHLVNPREGNQALPGPGPINPRRPLFGALPLVTNISYTDSSAIMNYNAMQLSARKRLSHGLEFLAAYTLSKTMSDNLGYYGSGGVAGMSAYWQNAYDRHGDYGPAFFDARHNLTFSGFYELPVGQGRAYGSDWNPVVNAVLGGWQLGYVWSAHSGFPITVTSPGRSNSGNRANRAMRFRPLVIENQSIDNWFGTHASSRPCAFDVDNGVCAYGSQWTNQFGTTGISTERAPHFNNIDLTIGKRFPVTEAKYLEFRAELFNAFNMVSFGPPNRDTSSTQWGFINGQINPARNIQLGLKFFF
ncbi:MAG: TonB-dependent receptor [Acidobacteria bacterium]|nr:TonB-dependent receptor [Acidobacteriota bacterium]